MFDAIYRQHQVNTFAQAAATLGARKFQILKQIVVPILLQKALPSIILYAVFIFGAYEVPMLLGQQEPQMISVLIAQKFTRYNLADVPVAYAYASIYTLLVIIVLWFLFRRGKLIHEME